MKIKLDVRGPGLKSRKLYIYVVFMCSISVPVKEELRVPALWIHKKYENCWDVHIFCCIEAPNSPPPPSSSSSKSMKIAGTFMFFCYIEAPNSPPHPLPSYRLPSRRRLNSNEFFDFLTRGGSERELIQGEERRANNPQKNFVAAREGSVKGP